jgi:carotenoid cleavage dioxygenase-like enzyme
MTAGGFDRRAFLRRSAQAAVALGSSGALLAACGNSGSGDGAGAAGTTSAPATPTTLSAEDAAKPWFLRANFAPVTDEVEVAELRVRGSIPEELSGLYVRNGSNPLPGYSPHWFLGDGMVHGVLLDEGKAAWYRNRYVQTTLLAAGGGLAAAGAPGGAAGLSNVSVIHHAGKLLSLGEVGLPYELAPAELSTVGPYDFAGKVTGNVTAHPKIDPATGDMHFFGYNFTAPFLSYYVADATGVLVSAEGVEVGAASMIHDFAITDRDVIFWEFPILFDFDLALEMVSDPKSTVMPFVWTPSYGARIGVMPLGGPTSAIRWVEIEPAYVFHGVNAYRDGSDVVVDVCHLDKVFSDGSALGPPPTLHRWRIDTAGTSLTFRDDVLSDRPADLPSIDRRRTGRDYRHSWRVEVTPRTDTVEMRGVVHYDVQSGKEQRYDPGPSRSSGEWLFVPRGKQEGDGFLVTYVYDATTDGSELVILDAQDVGAGPLAEVSLPERVPYGFHATWVPAEAV